MFRFLCNVLQIVVSHSFLFHLAIVLYVHLRFTDSDYSFGIFNVRGVWSSPNTLPTMVHWQVFRFISWQPPPIAWAPLICHLRSSRAVLWVRALRTFTITELEIFSTHECYHIDIYLFKFNALHLYFGFRCVVIFSYDIIIVVDVSLFSRLLAHLVSFC